jgi:sulfatase modifying factor 1
VNGRGAGWRAVAMWVAVAAASGCRAAEERPVGIDAASEAGADAGLDGGAEAGVGSAAASDAGVDGAQEAEAQTTGCPEGSVLVEGEYCPVVDEKCLEHHKEWERDHSVSERCLRYDEPTKCLSKQRVHMRFCMDRYEWPNEKGEVPLVLVNWFQAVDACKAAGKRLCTEDEFNFACEGEKMLPYVYGYARDATKCNIDKDYRPRRKSLAHYEKCMKSPKCKAEFEKLDQRAPAGSFPECVSPFGIYDLNGNVNEWVNLPDEKPPNRSGLKGGWWGPVRNRCRPTVTFHKEEDYGYEAGFRCCADATPATSGDR